MQEDRIHELKGARSSHFLSPRLWGQITLTNCEAVNHDTRLYRFALPCPDQPLGLPTGQHVFIRLRRKDTGELVQRAYTPVSGRDAKGYIEFLIKSVSPLRSLLLRLLESKDSISRMMHGPSEAR